MTAAGDTDVRPVTHDLPTSHTPVTALQEELSVAYLHMLATAAGLNVGSWGHDYDGIDVTLKSGTDYDPFRLHPKLDVQLKCTGQKRAVRPDSVAWKLNKRTVKLLRAPNRDAMALFCTLVIPEKPGHWLSHPDDVLLSHCTMYWIRGADIPAVDSDKKSVVVHLPRRNVLTAPVLLELMEEAARWEVGGS